jgi:adenylosuccinate synthase
MIKYADVVCGLAWGDEAKGKITSQLAASGEYDYVCRWAGGNNAGHTVYVGGKKFKTHLIPSGIFYGIKSVIGPGCVLNIQSFFDEIGYLREFGFDTSLIKISPKTHIVTSDHIEKDRASHYKSLGTTAKGIGPCYSAKTDRTGLRAESFEELSDYIWDEKLEGRILCEGAQGFWLDLDYGNYPYVTSSSTLPYSACSLGFPPQKIRRVFGAAKIYDTRSGKDPDFPERLLEDTELNDIGTLGQEYGVTTGRRRKVNWLNLDKLITAVNVSGTTDLVVSKTDILESFCKFKFFYNDELLEFKNITEMKRQIFLEIKKNCCMINNIKFSNSPEHI